MKLIWPKSEPLQDVLLIVSIEDILIRYGEVRMVQRVECVSAELHVDALPIERKTLGQAKVRIEVPRTALVVAVSNRESYRSRILLAGYHGIAEVTDAASRQLGQMVLCQRLGYR